MNILVLLYTTDRHTLWLKEVTYAIERDHRNIRKKQKTPNSKDKPLLNRDIVAYRGKICNQKGRLHPKNQEIRKLSAFKPFQDRQADIVAYSGAICPMVHWIIGMLCAKT